MRTQHNYTNWGDYVKNIKIKLVRPREDTESTGLMSVRIEILTGKRNNVSISTGNSKALENNQSKGRRSRHGPIHNTSELAAGHLQLQVYLAVVFYC